METSLLEAKLRDSNLFIPLNVFGAIDSIEMLFKVSRTNSLKPWKYEALRCGTVKLNRLKYLISLGIPLVRNRCPVPRQ